jgi:hypothetical protein
MKPKITYLSFLLCIATIACAATKEYTILGDQKISAKVQDGLPLPGEKNGIKVEGAGFVLGEGKLIWGFDFTSKKEPTKILIEDVSGKSAIILVDDAAPKIKGHDWSGNAAPVSLSKSDCPWLFESGDTTKIFRFTITLKGKSEPVVIYQPAVYPEATKHQLRQMAQ